MSLTPYYPLSNTFCHKSKCSNEQKLRMMAISVTRSIYFNEGGWCCRFPQKAKIVWKFAAYNNKFCSRIRGHVCRIPHSLQCSHNWSFWSYAVSKTSDLAENQSQCPPCWNFFSFLILLTIQQRVSLHYFSVVRMHLAVPNDPLTTLSQVARGRAWLL